MLNFHLKPDIFCETLESLCEKGWLLKNRETDSYKMHRIIADVIKKQHPVQLAEVERLIGIITEALSVYDIKDNPVDIFPLIPFGKSALSVFPNNDQPAISLLQNNLALVVLDLGYYEGAKTLLEKALTSYEKDFGPDNPFVKSRIGPHPECFPKILAFSIIKQFAKQKWNELTDDSLDYIEGSRDRMVGKIQEKYSKNKEEAEKEADEFS